MVVGKYDYLANAVVGVQYIRNNANLFNFNSTYMEYLNEAEKTCGYADYLEKYYSFVSHPRLTFRLVGLCMYQ